MYNHRSTRGMASFTWMVIFVGALAVGSAATYFIQRSAYWSDYPELGQRPGSQRRAWTRTGTKPEFFNDWHCNDRVRWTRDRFREYGITEGDIITTARSSKIPPRLLAVAIINELSDYDMMDHAQEYMYAKFGKREYSYGIAQLQPDRVLDHKLATFPEAMIRENWHALGGHAPGYRRPGDADIRLIQGDLPPWTVHRDKVKIYLAWRMLIRPKSALKIAAAELRYILLNLNRTRGADMVRMMLRGPLDLGNPFGNVQAQPHPYFLERSDQQQREATLTYAAMIDYNTKGKLRTLKGTAFYRHELTENDGENAELNALGAVQLWLSCFMDANYPYASDSDDGFFGLNATGTRYAYVVDMSGSMKEKGRMARAKRELRKSITTLPAGTPFRVVFFSDGAYTPPTTVANSEWIRSGSTEARSVLSWADAVTPRGGTRPIPAFRDVLSTKDKPDVIFFLTDGTFNTRVPEQILELNRVGGRTTARIYTVALGDRTRASQLHAIARLSGGTSVEVKN